MPLQSERMIALARRTLPLTLLWVAAVCFAQASSNSQPDSGPEANPARPTVTTPATLTPVGYLQFETGAFGADHSPEFSRRENMVLTAKITIHPRLQVFSQVEPIVHTQNEITQSKLGDAFVGVQGVLIDGKESRPTVSASYVHQIRDGAVPDVDFGSATNSLLLLVSGDVKHFHYDSNAIFNEQTDTAISRAQFGQTLSVSHNLARFTIAGEIWHFTQPFLRSNAVGNLWAVSYEVRKTLVLDAGFDHGLTNTSTRWEVFGGFTYLLPRKLWR
jgi:hypothetical protein